MKKFSRLPHEQAVPDGDSDPGPEHDGLPVDSDVEGHRAGSADRFLPGLPGTGGDNLRRRAPGAERLHRPASGGELDGSDVEGHVLGHTRGERLSPGMPGTGGDRISVDVEDDDTEGHRQS